MILDKEIPPEDQNNSSETRLSRSRGWDKEIPHDVLPMKQLVLSDKWARKLDLVCIGMRERITSNG